MKALPVVDVLIILAYLVGMVAVGVYFSRRNKNADQFTTASGRMRSMKAPLSKTTCRLSPVKPKP